MSPVRIVSPHRRERSHRKTLPALGDCPESCVASHAQRHKAGHVLGPFAPIRKASSSGVILLAGSDAEQRATLREEIEGTLTRRTRFAEADAISEVLENAPFSRLVVLVGDLEDAEADSLMRLLGQRHPQLPVVRVRDEPSRTGAPSHRCSANKVSA